MSAASEEPRESRPIVEARAVAAGSVGGGLERSVRRALAVQRLERIRRRRQRLVCLPFDRQFAAVGDDRAARAACEARDAWKSCAAGMAATERPRATWALAHCPRLRAMAAEPVRVAVDVAGNLERAKAPGHEARLVRDAADGGRTLRPEPPLLAVRNWLARARPELLLFLAGPTGVGKTVAACYALARRGGLYAMAYALWRPGFSVEAAQAADLLVIDQLGRENIGASAFGLQLFEEIVVSRVQEERATILCGNLERPQFDRRYEDVVADRFRGFGLWLDFDGDSLRVQK